MEELLAGLAQMFVIQVHDISRLTLSEQKLSRAVCKKTSERKNGSEKS
jgi:hypothetical protein